MPKYSKEEIQKRALIFVEAYAQKDERALQVVLTLSIRTGLSAEVCLNKIFDLAEVGR